MRGRKNKKSTDYTDLVKGTFKSITDVHELSEIYEKFKEICKRFADRAIS